jgi:hypothetical protein
MPDHVPTIAGGSSDGESQENFAFASATSGGSFRRRSRLPEGWRPEPAEGARLPGGERLTAHERDGLAERGAARTSITNRGVLVPDRHAAEKDEPIRG